jgi:enamine deaminase RidA (YjgF/YER057c/UK114 family)
VRRAELVFIAGQIGWTARGDVEQRLRGQFRQRCRTSSRAGAAGGRPSIIVRLTWYVSTSRNTCASLREVGAPTANSWAPLPDDGGGAGGAPRRERSALEIEATAVIPDACMKVTVIGGGPGGLYFALLAKKHWPRWDVTVHERNRPDDTFGFGVVFLGPDARHVQGYDVPSYERSGGASPTGATSTSSTRASDALGRQRLLRLLARCAADTAAATLPRARRAARVPARSRGRDEFPDSDLIVVADGINSKIREKHRAHFWPSVDLRPNKFTWLGSTKPLDAFKYFFRSAQEDHPRALLPVRKALAARGSWRPTSRPGATSASIAWTRRRCSRRSSASSPTSSAATS